MDNLEDAPMRVRALRLLEIIRVETEGTNQPIFLQSVAQKLGMSEAEARPAFRYLADRRWIDTFRLPYTGRINAAGHDALENYKQEQQESTARLATRTSTSLPSPYATMEWDVFVSHASEDKDLVARPLANFLDALGLRVWYDEATLTMGDSLRRSIDAGLSRSRFGVVILSHQFFDKEWPQRELDGLVAREIAGVKVILPVWHDITQAEVAARSPTLADRLAASTSKGLDRVAQEIVRVVRRDSETIVARASEETKSVPITVTAPATTSKNIREEQPFRQAEEKDGPTRFRAPGTALGIREGIALIDSGVGNEVFLASGAAISLRLMPPVELDKKLTIAELRRAIHQGINLPTLLGLADGQRIIRAEDGIGTCIIYAPEERETDYVTYAFKSGEIWAFSTFPLKGHPNELFVGEIERMLLEQLPIYAKFLELLGVRPPYRWIAALDGVKSRELQYPVSPRKIRIPGFDRHHCVSASIVAEGSYDAKQTPTNALLPFFDEIYDRCGMSRPEHLPR